MPELPRGTATWDALFETIRNERTSREWPEDDVLVLITSRDNEFRWFSASNPSSQHERSIFIHGCQWEWVTPAPLTATLAAEIVTNLFLLGARAVNEASEDLGHSASRGCIADFCENKTEAAMRLRTADICGECLDRFEKRGASDRIIRQAVSILEDARRLSLGTTQYQPLRPLGHPDFPHPVALTRHKAHVTRDQDHHLRYLLNHLDCLIRYANFYHAAVSQRPIENMPDNPTLGWWVARLAHMDGGPDLKDAHRLVEHHQLAHHRNCEAHEYGPPPGTRDDDGRIRILEDALSGLERLLMASWPNYLVSIDALALRDGAYVASGRLIKGSNTIFDPFELSIRPGSHPISVGIRNTPQLALYAEASGQFFDCSPYMRLAHCPTCAHERLLLHDGGARYLDPYLGHRVNLPHVGGSLT